MGSITFFPGGDTVEYTEGKNTSTKKKAPCKYGARVNGYCPKKPKSTAAKKAPAAKRPCKYGRGTDGYCKKKPRAGSSNGAVYEPPTETAPKKKETEAQRQRRIDSNIKAITNIAKGATDIYLADPAKTDAAKVAIAAAAALPISQIGKLGKAAYGVVGLIGVAGIASYWLTSKVITYFPKKEAEKQRAAGEAADAYYVAKRDIIALQGGKGLTQAQFKTLSDAFKKKLVAIGVQWPLKNQGV